MHQHTQTRAPFSFATNPRTSRRPERISPALIRRMAARMALEARQIEQVAQEAMREVWEESAHTHPLSSLPAHTT